MGEGSAAPPALARHQLRKHAPRAGARADRRARVLRQSRDAGARGRRGRFGRFENLRRLEAEHAFRGRRLAPADPDNADLYKVRRGKVAGYRDYFNEEQLAAIDRLTSTTLSPFFGYPDTYVQEPAAAG